MKKIFFLNTFLLLCSGLLMNCTREVTSEVEFVPQIFITGGVNAVEKKATLRIQRSVPIDSNTPDFVTNAKVTLYTKDKNGNTSVVTNNFSESNGAYESIDIIDPIVGNQYWIEVSIPNEDSFKSIPETLKEIVPIKSIEIVNNIPRIIFDDVENERNFYYLSIVYFIDFNPIDSDEIVINDILFDGNKDTFLEPEINKAFDILLVQLTHVNANTYQYLTNVDILREFRNINIEGENPGELFSTPPVNVTGNMTNTTKSQTALGNFAAINYDTSIFTIEITANKTMVLSKKHVP
ncbi:hypothetical protein ABW636_19700 [Aquimarina sp. 2201CG1-2-11]|uniref:hypothetical protein n=1 Tax=Aquimarina discodermiae TaxID=3231043 RepID=UPI003462CFC5